MLAHHSWTVILNLEIPNTLHKTKTGMIPRRYIPIDVLRGLAIFAMIQSHLWGIFIIVSSPFSRVFEIAFVKPLGGFAAPLFILVSGLSTGIASAKWPANRNPISPWRVRTGLFKKGLLLFLLSSAINVIGNLFIAEVGWLNWSVFQLVGVCQMIVALIATTSFWIYFILAGLILSVSSLATASHPASQAIFPFLYHGFVPFLPWSALFFTGMALKDLCMISMNQHDKKSLGILSCAGISIIALAGVLDWLGIPFNHWDKTLGMNLTSYCVYLGVFLLFFPALVYLFEARDYQPGIARGLVLLGQHALTVYYAQWFILIGLGYVFRHYWKTSTLMPFYTYIPILCGLMVAMFWLLVRWARNGYKYSIEWLIRELAYEKT